LEKKMSQAPKQKPEFVPNRAKGKIALSVAAVAGVFALVVAALLVINYLQTRASDPLDNPELLRLREELSAGSGENEELVYQIRSLDLLARRAFFTSQAQLQAGGWLLLAAATVFLVAFRLAARWNPKIPVPLVTTGGEDAYWRVSAQARELITGTAVILVLVTLAAAYMTPLNIPAPEMATAAPAPPPDEPGEAPAEAASPVLPAWEEMLVQWPSFRGPGGVGVAHFTTAPVHWDVETGEGVRWNVEGPPDGFNSPVVWGQRLYFSTATSESREVLCHDTETGDLLWRKALPPFPGSPETPPRVTDDTGYAAPTMAVHGSLAFAIFGTGDIACLDEEGNVVWGRNLGVPDNHYGHASSLIALDDKIFVQFDDRKAPRLIALDAATGEDAWTTHRKKISWASPACPPTPFGFQVILASERDVDAYDPATGDLLWTQTGLGGEVAPSPAILDDIVLVANEYSTTLAVKLSEADGGVASEILWEYDDSLPEVASPTSGEGYFYIATSMGDFVCLDATTGEEAWRHEFDKGFYSSPVRVGDRLYFADRQGTMHIIKTGGTFELIASLPFPEPVYATPAFLDGRMYVRTASRLMCLEAPDGN
jgi:outer membrane protein assembly factor BamB